MISVSNLSVKAQCVVQFFLLHHLLISSMLCPQKKTTNAPDVRQRNVTSSGEVWLLYPGPALVKQHHFLPPLINLLRRAFLAVHLHHSLLSAWSCSSFPSVSIPLSLTSPAKKIPCRLVFRTPCCWRCGLWPLRVGKRNRVLLRASAGRLDWATVSRDAVTRQKREMGSRTPWRGGLLCDCFRRVRSR
jgi:hypothetical protein